MEQASTTDIAVASVTRGGADTNSSNIIGWFTVDCYGADGQLKWKEEFPNGVTDQGKSHLLTVGITGSAVTVASRMAFLTTSTFSATSTYATPSPIVEAGAGVFSTRATPTWAATSGSGTVSRALSTPVNVTAGGSATISGIAIMLATAAVTTLGTVSDTAQTGGVLYSVGTFAASKAVTSGDQLNVSYTTSLA